MMVRRVRRGAKTKKTTREKYLGRCSIWSWTGEGTPYFDRSTTVFFSSFFYFPPSVALKPPGSFWLKRGILVSPRGALSRQWLAERSVYSFFFQYDGGSGTVQKVFKEHNIIHAYIIWTLWIVILCQHASRFQNDFAWTCLLNFDDGTMMRQRRRW